MGYRIKNEVTGQLGWQVYPDKRGARAAAKTSAAFHKVKVSVVQANGAPCATRAKVEDNFSAMLRTINFACAAGR